jgi:hypothetical protein
MVTSVVEAGAVRLYVSFVIVLTIQLDVDVGRGPMTNDDRVGEAISELERALAAEDPAFVTRVRRLQRGDSINVIVVFVLLAAGAVLLTVGVSLTALIPWLAGVASLVSAVLVDDHHKRTLRQ